MPKEEVSHAFSLSFFFFTSTPVKNGQHIQACPTYDSCTSHPQLHQIWRWLWQYPLQGSLNRSAWVWNCYTTQANAWYHQLDTRKHMNPWQPWLLDFYLNSVSWHIVKTQYECQLKIFNFSGLYGILVSRPTLEIMTSSENPGRPGIWTQDLKKIYNNVTWLFQTDMLTTVPYWHYIFM